MQEVKKPKKPLIYYYAIVLAVLLLFNFLLMPWAAERQVKEVGYDTFIEMTDDLRHGEEQCQGICEVLRGHPLLRCGRRG